MPKPGFIMKPGFFYLLLGWGGPRSLELRPPGNPHGRGFPGGPKLRLDETETRPLRYLEALLDV